jgi:hypothetical protein
MAKEVDTAFSRDSATPRGPFVTGAGSQVAAGASQ